MKTAHEYAKAIWSDMTGRSGMDFDIDDETQIEILRTWEAIFVKAIAGERRAVIEEVRGLALRTMSTYPTDRAELECRLCGEIGDKGEEPVHVRRCILWPNATLMQVGATQLAAEEREHLAPAPPGMSDGKGGFRKFDPEHLVPGDPRNPKRGA